MLNAGLISAVINVQLISAQKKCFSIPMYDICVHGNGTFICIFICICIGLKYSTVMRIISNRICWVVKKGTIFME
jgi:hypothetical protein